MAKNSRLGQAPILVVFLLWNLMQVAPFLSVSALIHSPIKRERCCRWPKRHLQTLHLRVCLIILVDDFENETGPKGFLGAKLLQVNAEPFPNPHYWRTHRLAMKKKLNGLELIPHPNRFHVWRIWRIPHPVAEIFLTTGCYPDGLRPTTLMAFRTRVVASLTADPDPWGAPIVGLGFVPGINDLVWTPIKTLEKSQNINKNHVPS